MTSAESLDFYTRPHLFLNYISGQIGNENTFTFSDEHCYCLRHNAHPTSPLAFAAVELFPSNNLSKAASHENEIDVTSTPNLPFLPFENNRARTQMNDGEKFVATLRGNKAKHGKSLTPDTEAEPPDESVDQSTWSAQEKRLYDRVIRILTSEHLSRLALKDQRNELVLRRISTDRTASKLRQVFMDFASWDSKLLQWLHLQLMNTLNSSYLAMYVECLQFMRSKVPLLVERILSKVPRDTKIHHTESLSAFLKRQWDPLSQYFTAHRPKRLNTYPIFLWVPTGAQGHLPRMRAWYSALSQMAKVIIVNVTPPGNNYRCSMAAMISHYVSVVRARIEDARKAFPDRPIVLLGWDFAALAACNVALVEKVDAVVCVGFPMNGFDGPRDVDDALLDGISTPVLFIVGSEALSCSVDDIDSFRGNMKAPNGLVIVNGCNDRLHMSYETKRHFCVTQNMVDRCIIDAIGEFLDMVLTETPDVIEWKTMVQESKKQKVNEANCPIITEPLISSASLPADSLQNTPNLWSSKVPVLPMTPNSTPSRSNLHDYSTSSRYALGSPIRDSKTVLRRLSSGREGEETKATSPDSGKRLYRLKRNIKKTDRKPVVIGVKKMGKLKRVGSEQSFIMEDSEEQESAAARGDKSERTSSLWDTELLIDEEIFVD